ncbi:hypothetical protein [Sulfurimonas sp.]|mgnify:CR=1 FL=1|jgi:hypothetical protein|uniref:hypothetical protein n=1 Tax=Sulfurimonas sp. TaxID=2022749 RepID=UPI0025FB18C5|nr:hypothetical protein [Sulfurimonas sp.]MBT5935646.1 hypothetical protein [Sulfurimonas sp.]
MSLQDMQKELDSLYRKILNRERLEKEFGDTIEKGQQKGKAIAEVLSAPFILHIDEKYIDAKKKVLYIGRETNIWWGQLHQFMKDTEGSIELLKERYKAEFDGGEVIKGNGKLAHYEKEKFGSSAFFNKYKYTRDNLKDNENSLIWTNLLKMDSGAKGYSKNSIKNEKVQKISKEILQAEIEILKPDAIIFLTATAKNTKAYDDFIKDVFEGYETLELVSGQYWKFQYKNIDCYRTLHPQSHRFRKDITTDYYKKIVDDINNS